MSISDSSTSNRIKKFRSVPSQCRICDASARYSYYGVISCVSCKTFFRRCATAEQGRFVCHFDGQCDINLNTRHLCTACRLAKCFASGMSTDFFRASRTATSNSARLLVPYRSKRLSTLNLLDSDISTLTTDQWSLLSNLIQIYQESQLTAIAQRLTQTHLNYTNRSSMDMIYGKLIEEWGMSVYETTSRYLRLNDDLCQLPSDDRSVIVRTATANISCMGSTLITRNYPLYHIDIFTNTITNVYGEDVINKHRWSMKFMDSDTVLLKLALSLFAFSELNYSYSPSVSTDSTNVLNSLKVQNKYAEVTWKYLLYRYGFHQAVARFLNLTSWFIATTHYIAEMQNLSLQADNINSLVEETELKLVLDDIDRITEINE